MEQHIPHKRVIRLALITSPFFGMFAAAPPLTRMVLEPKRSILTFLFVTVAIFFLWMFNLLLLKFFNKYKLRFKEAGRYFFSVIIVMTAVYLIYYLLIGNPPKPPMLMGDRRMLPPGGFRFIFPLLQPLAVDVIILILLDMIMLKEKKVKIESENTALKLAHSEAKNILLQQQLNPHFLFNSLSTLGSLIKRDTGMAEDYLQKLSGILRFSIHNSLRSLVPLRDEVELCNYYLEMQQVRFGKALVFIINVPEKVQESTSVPAFSLQLLIENAIKHNILTNEMPLCLQVAFDLHNHSLTVTNTLQLKPLKEPGSGTGLVNLAERYRLLNAGEVKIEKTKGFFIVNIPVVK